MHGRRGYACARALWAPLHYFFGNPFKTILKQNMDEVQGATLPNFMSTPVFRKALQTIYFEKASASNPIDGVLKISTQTIVSGIGEAMLSAIESLIDEHMSESPKLVSFFKEKLSDLYSVNCQKQSSCVTSITHDTTCTVECILLF